ncbi:YitT family protein [Mycoplasma sp. 327]
MDKKQKNLDKKIQKTKLSVEQKKALYDEKMAILNPQQVTIFNIWKKYPKKVIWMLLSAFLYNIAITVFLRKAATIASGTSSLSQIITFTAPATAQFYGLFYVLVNLPLMFVFWRMNPRMFMVLTYYWMLFQVIVQLIYIEYDGRGSNPIVNFINQKISFYNPVGENNFYWAPFGIDTRVVSKLYNNGQSKEILKVLQGENLTIEFDKGAKEVIAYFQNQYAPKDLNLIVKNITDSALVEQFKIGKVSLLGSIPLLLKDTKIYGVYDGQNWPVLVYAIMGGASEGFASIVAWRQKGSIGGTSVISNFIAYKNKKPVGNVFLMVAICFSSSSTIIIGSLEFSGNITGHVWNSGLFLVRILGTISYLLVFSTLVNKFYPKYKKVKIEIYTRYPEIVAEQFKKIGYAHSFNIFNGVGGFSHEEFGKIETVALFLEKDIIMEQVKKVDKSAWITTSNIHNISGVFDTSFVD